MRYLAIDIGDRYIGLAIGEKIAQPYDTLIRAGEFPYETIRGILTKEEIGKVIVGLPKHSESDDYKAKEYLEIAKKIEKELNIDVETIDETLTSQLANERLKEAGYTWQESKKKIHETSAQIILEDYLNQHD